MATAVETSRPLKLIGALPILHAHYGLSAERAVADIEGWPRHDPILGSPGVDPFGA
ncbi:MAG: hypothetical protein AcusKO_01190 [Acuticoccus sp.]